MSLLPSKPDLVADGEPRVVGVDSEDADALMAALSSGTARRLVAELHDEPAPPAELSERADTTLQNTQYHLSNLEDAGVVEVVGTAYSEKGREMDVYAPADQPLVIFAGEEQQASGIRAALSRLVGGLGALLVGSLAVQEVFGDGLGRLAEFGSSSSGAPRGGAPGGGTATATPAEGTTAGEGGAAGVDGSATPSATGAETTPTAAREGTATATPEVSASGGDGAASATRTAADTATEAAGEAASSTPAPSPSPTEVETATQVAVDGGGAEALTTLPPGALFFLGGLTVLLVVVALAWSR